MVYLKGHPQELDMRAEAGLKKWNTPYWMCEVLESTPGSTPKDDADILLQLVLLHCTLYWINTLTIYWLFNS